MPGFPGKVREEAMVVVKYYLMWQRALWGSWGPCKVLRGLIRPSRAYKALKKTKTKPLRGKRLGGLVTFGQGRDSDFTGIMDAEGKNPLNQTILMSLKAQSSRC